MDNHSSSLQPASALLPAPSHPSLLKIIQYLKESYQFAIIQEESSKPLITPWPCNPWPFTLLLLTHCCYPILPRRFGVQHISQGRKPGSLFMPFFLWRNVALCSAGLPRRLIAFIADLFNFNPVWPSPWGPPYPSMLSRRNKSASGYLFLLFKQAGDTSPRF